MPSQNVEFDIIIVGGGIVGLTLAASLAKTPLKLALIDQKPAPNEDFQLLKPYDLRVSALNHASQRLLSELGLWEQITQLRNSSYQEMHVWDANSPAEIHFSCTEIAQPYLGHIVEHSVLQQVLWDFLQQQPQIKLFSAVAPVSLLEGEDQVAIKLTTGDFLHARLLVGADGAKSWVAEQAKLPVNIKSYQQSALVTTVHLEHPHRHTAWQRFLTDGPLAFLPLSDTNMASIVWSTTVDRANYLQQTEEPIFNQELTQAIEYRFGKVQVLDKRLVFPLVQRHATQYVKPRIALVGDAAHTLHPLAGQGVNLGLADVRYLADVLQETVKIRRDIGGMTALRRYERTRKSANTMMIAAMAGFKQLFGHHQEIIRHIRFAGFALTDKLPFIKKQFMRAAAFGGFK